MYPQILLTRPNNMLVLTMTTSMSTTVMKPREWGQNLKRAGDSTRR